MSAEIERRVRIVHETNPAKYYPAIFELHRQGQIRLVGAYRNSVFKETLRSTIQEKRKFRLTLRNIYSDAAFRFSVPYVRGETIVLAFAPWDWRLLIYAPLRRRNRVVYHTSWPYWTLGRTPRKYGPLDTVLKCYWRRVLKHPNVTAVSVLEAPQQALRTELGVESTVIPHAVPEVFFSTTVKSLETSPRPLKLLFVGELSVKKGVPQLLSVLKLLPAGRASLTLVGDGSLKSLCQAAANRGEVTFLGALTDRQQLAEVMADHDVLLLLSQRQDTWEELFGIVLIEAMASGMGIIASAHVGPRSLVGPLQMHNLFEDDDTQGVAILLNRLASDSEELSRFKNSHRRAAEVYRESRVTQQWNSVLR